MTSEKTFSKNNDWAFLEGVYGYDMDVSSMSSSSDDEKDDEGPFELVRTLSEHHWDAARREMAKKKLKRIRAGECNEWVYTVTRKTTRAQECVEHSFHNGLHKTKNTAKMPKAKRCMHKIEGKRQSRRCKNKTFYGMCHVHMPLYIRSLPPLDIPSSPRSDSSRSSTPSYIA